MPRGRFHELEEALAAYELFVPVREGDRHVVRPFVSDSGEPGSHQTWVRERATRLWRLDLFREPHDGDTWICRRDERIRMPYAQLIERTPEGIPYGRPEIVLLFKARAAREKDDDDFAAVLERLEPRRRRLLAELLETVHPGHRWLARLDRDD